MMRKFAHLIIKFRWLILITVFANTLFFGYQLKNLKIEQSLSDIMPHNHPYIKLHLYLEEVFGGVNLVSVVLKVKEGDIFNRNTLSKILRITEKIEFMKGVVPYRVASIASNKLRNIYVAEEEVEGAGTYTTIYNQSFKSMLRRIVVDGDYEYIKVFRDVVKRIASTFTATAN